MKSLFLTVLISLWVSNVSAHSALESTTPANEAVVTTIPPNLMLNFKHGIRLVQVRLTHAHHRDEPLDISGQSGFANQHEIPLKDMGSGAYVIDWRGLSEDGHAVSGSFGFTVE